MAQEDTTNSSWKGLTAFVNFRRFVLLPGAFQCSVWGRGRGRAGVLAGWPLIRPNAAATVAAQQSLGSSKSQAYY